MATQLTVVGRPRRHDGVGAALRGVYARQCALPDEFEKLLLQIDEKVSLAQH